MKKFPITTPLLVEDAQKLVAGDQVLLSGTIFTARDAAHKRFVQLLSEGKPLPFDFQDQIIYYTGPTPPAPGSIIGSAGPTTSSRMDNYTPVLIEKMGLRGMIGKGNRNNTVINAMKKYGCVYFAAVGGAGALISQSIISSEIVCYHDLGAEAVYRLTVKDFPLTVAIDSRGSNLYVSGPQSFRQPNCNCSNCQ